MNRRETVFALAALGAIPLASLAQPMEKGRRIGLLMGSGENVPQQHANLAAFKESLAALEWAEGRNLKIDVRWTEANAIRTTALAKELVALQPDAILSTGTIPTATLQGQTRSIPIVFINVSDPVGSGIVNTLARPGGNITGFIHLEASIIEKWLQFLKEVAPHLRQVAVMFNPQTAPYAEYYLQRLRAAAAKSGVGTLSTSVNSKAEIEPAIAGLGRKTGSGLIVLPDNFTTLHRRLIIAAAARSIVPAIYQERTAVEDGGLISYGVKGIDLFRHAASYIDRILRGAKPAELPVELPTTFELFVNLKTAKALGLTIPQSMLVLADKVIE
jgi:putative ABC transport system substrate-binding protein